MALARRERHGNPKGQRGNVYLAAALLPVGHPNTGVVCGSARCDHPATIWVIETEMSAYKKGERIFGFGRPAIGFVKVRVQDPSD